LLLVVAVRGNVAIVAMVAVAVVAVG